MSLNLGLGHEIFFSLQVAFSLTLAKLMIEDSGSGVKGKASPKFIERIAKLPAWEGLSEKS
jgi:hypothetical protein